MVDFYRLVQRLLENEAQIKSRSFKKMFASLKLVGFIVIHYCQTEDNLGQAKAAMNYLVLQTWAWILRRKLENQKAVLKQFRSILSIQHDLLTEYFEKTLPFALETDGLSSIDGGLFEDIGYPLRAIEYLGDLIYYFELKQYYPDFDGHIPADKKAAFEQEQKAQLIELITKNEGGTNLLIDNHYIPAALLVLFFCNCTGVSEGEILNLHNYISLIFQSLLRTRGHYKRWPELSNRINLVIEFNASQTRPHNYEDRSSVLIKHILEILILLGGDANYEGIRGLLLIENTVNLQLAFPDLDDTSIDFEEEFFRRNLRNHTYVETNIHLPEKADEYRKWIMDQEIRWVQFRTDRAGFPFLKTLSRIFYKNDIFPWDWRKHFGSQVPDVLPLI